MRFITKIIFFLLTVSNIKVAYCQFIYTKQASDNYWFKGVLEDSASKDLFITVSIIKSSSTYLNSQTSILKINKNGLLLDSIKLDTNFMMNNAPLKVNNHYFMLGSQVSNTHPSVFKSIPVIYKYDLNFVLLKKVVLDSNFINDEALVNNHLILKNNRLYMGFALLNYSKIRLFKLDLNLNKLDSLTFTGAYTCDLANYGNKLLLSGASFPMGSTTGKNQVAELDTNFTVISRFNLDSITSVNPGCYQKIGMIYGHTNLFELTPNKYMVTGFSQVTYSSSCQWYLKNITGIIKNNSQVVSSNIIGQNGKNHMYTMPVTSSHRRYNHIFNIANYGYNMSTPFPPQSSPTEIMVNKIDTSGNVVWVNYYNTPNYYYSPLGVYGTLDSGVVVTGMRYNLLSPAVPGACEGFVMKLDKNGVIQYTGINDKNILAKPLLNYYPNPAQNELNFDINSEGNFSLEVYNTLGELVIQKNNLNNQFKLNLSDINQGVYSFRLSSKSYNCSGKFIKE